MATKKRSTQSHLAEIDQKLEELTVELAETPPESPESPVEATTPAVRVESYTCNESDSYASLSARFCPEGMTKHQYAQELVKKNNSMALRPGATIVL